MDNTARKGGIFVIAIGLLFAAFGGFMMYEAISFTGRALPAEGEVIDIVVEATRDSEGDLSESYHPVLKYTDANGVEHTGVNPTGSSEYDYGIGERLEVLYDPNKPEDVRMAGFWALYLGPMFFLILGLITAFVGLGVFRVLGALEAGK